MSKKDTWMPLYIGDYTSATMRLTTQQHGAYLLLLMDYWKTGPLPDDDAQLAAIVKLDRKEWSRTAPTIRRFFALEEDGLLHQRRMDKELERVGRVSEARRDAALARHTKAEQEVQTAEQIGCKQDANASANEVHNDNTLGDIARGHALAPPSPSESKQERTSLRDDAAGVGKPDVRDKLWGVGVATFQAMSGLTGSRARSMIGRWVKDTNENCALVQAAIDAAASERPIDPIPWVTEFIERRSDRRLGVADKIARDLNLDFESLPRAADFERVETNVPTEKNGRDLVAHDAQIRYPGDEGRPCHEGQNGRRGDASRR